jgi:hypothetical protein
MCEFCGREECKLTKAEVIERGAIIESDASTGGLRWNETNNILHSHG